MFPSTPRVLTGRVGLHHLPDQARLKSLRDGFSLNIMIVGESGLGKSTFMNTLFDAPLFAPSKPQLRVPRQAAVEIGTRAADLYEKGVHLKLTVLDIPGFGDSIDNTDCWAPVADAIEARLAGYLERENRVRRPAAVDDRVHACLYFLQPTGHALKPLDVAAMRRLHGVVNLIPVIGRADTLTEAELGRFKLRILADLRYHGIAIYEPEIGDDDDDGAETQALVDCIPFAVVGARGAGTRVYPWGAVDAENAEHCDTPALRRLLVRAHTEDLRARTGTLYERWRTAHMLAAGHAQDDAVFSEADPAQRAEDERAAFRARLAKMEADMRAVFRQKIGEREAALQRAELELAARHRDMRATLDARLRALEANKRELESSSVESNKPKKGHRRG